MGVDRHEIAGVDIGADAAGMVLAERPDLARRHCEGVPLGHREPRIGLELVEQQGIGGIGRRYRDRCPIAASVDQFSLPSASLK